MKRALFCLIALMSIALTLPAIAQTDDDADGPDRENLRRRLRERAKQRMERGEGRQGRRAPKRLIEKFDSDGDGKLSAEERKAAHDDLVAKADTDGDGKVSREERRAFVQGQQGKKFDELDANDDNVISYDELRPLAEKVQRRMYDRLDTDGNGAVTPEEFRKSHGPRQGNRARRGQRGGQKD